MELRDNTIRLIALETVGYALLVPWAVVQVSFLVAAIWTSAAEAGGASLLGADASPSATIVLFMLPLIAMMLGVAGLHMRLWQNNVPPMLGALVVIASLCLVGSVIGLGVRL